MILSDTEIRHYINTGKLYIGHFNDKCVQPNSYDVHLHSDLLVPVATNIDLIVDTETTRIDLWAPWNLWQEQYIIPPGGVALGRTYEYFEFRKLAGRLEGVSSLGRIFLRVHVTAGFFDYGFEGTATVELKNDGPWPIRIKPSMRIGQMAFELVEGRVAEPYHGRYKGQVNPTPAKAAYSRPEQDQ